MYTRTTLAGEFQVICVLGIARYEEAALHKLAVRADCVFEIFLFVVSDRAGKNVDRVVRR